MAKTKVTVKFQILELIDGFLDNTTVNAIGRTVVDSAKRMISEGSSPVRGEGRFEKYKDRKKYPGDLKPARPVNLYLTGEMLKDFSFRPKDKDTIEVGFIDASERSKRLAEFHQTGTMNGDKGMAARPLVPTEKQEWAVSIMRDIRDEYGKRLATLIKKSNSKA